LQQFVAKTATKTHNLTMDFQEKIETDLAYMQNKVAELDQIVAELQAQVMRLEKQNEFLNRKIEDLDTEARPNRKPPHY
jgi:uncharacterized coiled-coil protein SlyX